MFGNFETSISRKKKAIGLKIWVIGFLIVSAGFACAALGWRKLGGLIADTGFGIAVIGLIAHFVLMFTKDIETNNDGT